jgi:hypothetical protein
MFQQMHFFISFPTLGFIKKLIDVCIFYQEQDDWFQREQELLQRIEEVSEKSNSILQAERVIPIS